MRQQGFAALAFATFFPQQSVAAGSAEDMAKSLANPVAALISVPFQFNGDRDFGAARQGERYTLNVQPVVPISMSEDWNLISRTILPIVRQEDVAPGGGRQDGLGDVVQSLFFSPKKPTDSGVIWGVGPVFLLPTASDDRLGGEKWGLGPTGVALKQDGPWTYGVLGNHLWSVAGTDSRADVSTTFLQPFLAYTTADAWTATIQTESTYDWKGRQWSVPVNVVVGKVTKIGDQLVQFSGGVRHWAEGPDGGPHGWGLRLIVTLLFPK